jgi:hypothetical protein
MSGVADPVNSTVNQEGSELGEVVEITACIDLPAEPVRAQEVIWRIVS